MTLEVTRTPTSCFNEYLCEQVRLKPWLAWHRGDPRIPAWTFTSLREYSTLKKKNKKKRRRRRRRRNAASHKSTTGSCFVLFCFVSSSNIIVRRLRLDILSSDANSEIKMGFIFSSSSPASLGVPRPHQSNTKILSVHASHILTAY